MTEILKKIVEETIEITKTFNLIKVVFYWNMPYNGVYTKCFDENNEEFISLSDDLALGNINPKLFSNFLIFIEESKKKQKTNKGTLTIYPNGEYESVFIWDESLEQERLLKSLRSHFTWLFIHSVYKIEDVFLPEQEWGTAILTMEFKDGKIQPLQITILFEGKMLHFSCGIENIGLSEDYSLAHNIKTYEDMYQLANQVDIKDKLFGSWTKVTITLKQNSTGDEMNWKNYIFE